MRVGRYGLVALAMTLLAEGASAHQLVDVKMTVVAPAFVAAGQRFSYQIVSDDLANDPAFGVIVTTLLPSPVTFVKASGSGWNCSESKLKVTCAAEQIAPGPNIVTIDVTAPAARRAILASTSVTSLGSVDPNAANDVASATTTIYDPTACAASSLQLLQPTDAGGPVSSPVHLTWTAVANAASYLVYAAVEGERSSVVATTRGTSISLPFEGGNVEWRVEALFGGCLTVSSATNRFLSASRPAALALQNFAGTGVVGARDGPSDSATFTAPAGVAINNGGDLFVADVGNFTIRQVSRGEVTTLSGIADVRGAADGRPGVFAGPVGITITALDDFAFIADRENNAVRLRYPGDRSLGLVITIGGALGQPGLADGLFEVSRYSAPSGVAGDPRGRLYVADSGNHRIRKLTSVPGYTGYYTSETFAGSGEGSVDGPASQARFRSPSGIVADGEETVYVADTGNHTVRKIFHGAVTTLAGSAGSPGSADGYGASARFNAPTAIAVDGRGNLYVCDTGNHTVRKVSPSGQVTTVAGLSGSAGDSEGLGAAARLSSPRGIVVDAAGSIYIADTGNHRIRIARVPAPPGERRRAVRP